MTKEIKLDEKILCGNYGGKLHLKVEDVREAVLKLKNAIKHCGNLKTKWDSERDCLVRDDSNAIIVLEYIEEIFGKLAEDNSPQTKSLNKSLTIKGDDGFSVKENKTEDTSNLKQEGGE